MTKIASPGQNSVILYFDFLTRKTTKLDFDVFIPNVDLYLNFKMYNNHLNLMLATQVIAEIG